MPHILLETTADLPENSAIPDILEALTAKLASYDTIDSKSLKAYHGLRSNWAMGEGAPAGFAHCCVQILSGRPLDLRRDIAQGMYDELRRHFAESIRACEVSITLELREMDRETYCK